MAALTPISGVGSVGLEGSGSGVGAGAGAGSGVGGGGKGVRRGRSGWVGLGLRWSGRACAALLAIFWGLFFVEHVNAWYFDPRGWPPLWVTAAMVAHGLIILGLAAMLRWTWVGAALTLIGTIGFLTPTLIGGKPAWLMLINLVPVGMVVFGELRRGR